MALLAPSAPSWATSVSQPQLVEVELGPGHEVATLLREGFDVASVRGGNSGTALVLVRSHDASRLAALGFTSRLIDAAPGATAAARTRAELASRPSTPATAVWSAARSDGRFRTESLPPFGAGSMGGYWTAAEVKMKLDALVANDAQDLVAAKIDTLGYSLQGRPIWGLRIKHAVAGTDTRPVVFYSALIHSREPEGMQAMFWFIDDLLGKYGADPMATWVLEQRQLYIVPIVNPDGYAVTESVYTSSAGTEFGFWRKNLSDNDSDGVLDDPGDGVDLNRNFGFKWGIDDFGSSPDPTTETYRGSSAFSEPETRAVRDAIIALQPATGFAFHTYSDLLLHPWGYTNDATPDLAAFREWGDLLSRDNGYLHGNSPAVLYTVNGEFNDWVYGDTLAKARGYTWTPEIGSDNDGFWPQPSRIVPLAEEMLAPCYRIAALAGQWVQEDGVTLAEGAMNAGRLTNMLVRARHVSVSSVIPAGMTGTLVALDAGAHVLAPNVTYPKVGARHTVSPNGLAPFQVALDDTVTPGRLMRFQVTFQSATAFGRDTIVVPAGTPTVLLADGASAGTTGWNIAPTGAWSVVQNDAAHPSRYFAQRGASDYLNSAEDQFILRTRLNLSTGVHAYALYDATWEYEQNWDGGLIEASTDSVSWFPLRSTGSTPGSGMGKQSVGQPFFAGARRNWGAEITDLSPYTGPTRTRVHLRFRGRTDASTTFDGLAFDSLRIVIFDPATQPTPVAVSGASIPASVALSALWPNPSRGLSRIELALPQAADVRLDVIDLQGRQVRELVRARMGPGMFVRGWDLADDRGHRVPAGVYFVRLDAGERQAMRRMVVLAP